MKDSRGRGLTLRCPHHPAIGPLERRVGRDGATGWHCRHAGCLFDEIDGIPSFPEGGCTADPRLSAERRQWDEQAARYDAPRLADPVYMAGVAAAVRVLRPTAGDYILDAGCGTGLTVVGSIRAGAEVVALDSSLQSLEVLRQRRAGRMVHPVHGSLTQLPFSDDSFDAVLCANVLQNIEGTDRRERCVRELARVCRPGGRVVVTVHHYSRPRRRAGWRKEGPSGGHSGPIDYIYRFVPAEFRDLLARALAVRRLTGSGFPLPYRFRLGPVARLLECCLTRSAWALSWSSMLVADCRKQGGPLPPAQSTRAGNA